MSKRKQSKGELDRSPRAVASPNRTSVPFASFPAGEHTRGRSRGCGRGCLLATHHSPLATAVQQEVDRCTRSLLARAFQPAHTHRLQPGRPYGISVRALRLSLRADGFVHRTSRSHAADAVATQRLPDTPCQPVSASVVAVSQHSGLSTQDLSVVVALAVSLICDRHVVAVRSPAAQPPKSWSSSFAPRPRPATRYPWPVTRDPAVVAHDPRTKGGRIMT